MFEVSKIYDHLLKFESRYRSGKPYAIHKKLRNPFGYKDLLEWMIAYVPFNEKDVVLDAGCGTGHTLFFLHERVKLGGLGISLSPLEIEYAKAYCDSRNYNESLKFEVGDFKILHSGPYSRIICIESLKHVSALEKTIINLMDQLTTDGRLLIIDDFTEMKSKDVERQKKLWSAPSFQSLIHFTEILEKQRSFAYEVVDFTQFVSYRPVWFLKIAKSVTSFANWITFGLFHLNINTYLGGLLLEELYAQKCTKYIAIIVETKVEYNGNK